jgi:tetrahydromethanopterin S-methyltransferase subunit F
MSEAGDGDLQQQVDDLQDQLTSNRGDIETLVARADAADRRADASEARAEIDRQVVAELEASGELSRAHVEQLEAALKSSRTIGAAIGMLMASRLVGEEEAFAILKQASQRGNVKIRDLAADLVRTGKLSSVDG